MAQIAQTRTGKVLTLTIDRPEKKNALTNAMYGQLADALDAARSDDGVRCVVITGAGDTFTAGNDLGDFAAVASGDLKHLDRHVHRVLDGLATFEKPVVAAVPGLAVGIGTTMLLHCDLVFLSETALLSTPFVDLALVPEAASSLLLQARIGYARAFAMFALGEKVDAASALAWGLANRVVAGDKLHGVAMAARGGPGDAPARRRRRHQGADARPRRAAGAHRRRGQSLPGAPRQPRGARGLHRLPPSAASRITRASDLVRVPAWW